MSELDIVRDSFPRAKAEIETHIHCIEKERDRKEEMEPEKDNNGEEEGGGEMEIFRPMAKGILPGGGSLWTKESFCIWCSIYFGVT